MKSNLTWLLIGISCLVGGFFAGKGCNKPRTITKKDAVNFLKEEAGQNVFFYPIGTLSTIIPDSTAKKHHMDYLNSSIPIYEPGSDQAVRSFFLEYKDLVNLTSNTTTGVRVYLGSTKNARDEDSLNLIFIPQDVNGENIFGTPSNSLIVNTLSPCPNDCPKKAGGSDNSENDLNYDSVNGYDSSHKWRVKIKTERGKTWEKADRSDRKEK